MTGLEERDLAVVAYVRQTSRLQQQRFLILMGAISAFVVLFALAFAGHYSFEAVAALGGFLYVVSLTYASALNGEGWAVNMLDGLPLVEPPEEFDHAYLEEVGVAVEEWRDEHRVEETDDAASDVEVADAD